MKMILFAPLLAAMALLAGCCGLTGPSSCTTYGEACTEFCEKSKGTQFDPGGDCFTTCMGEVKAQGLGDSTTCCKESMRTQCQSTCDAKFSQLYAKYGASAMDPGEKQDFIDGCLAECQGMYEQIGMPLDSCSLVDVSALLAQ